jgi:hypothetical protein
MEHMDPRFVSFRLSSALKPEQGGKMRFQTEIHLKNDSPLGDEQVCLSVIVETDDPYPINIQNQAIRRAQMMLSNAGEKLLSSTIPLSDRWTEPDRDA